jgi:HD-like signal output (HDOD) protein
MVSLFFWRKKKQADPFDVQAAAAADPTLIVPPPTRRSVARLPVHRLVYALALNDPRAADPEATPDATQNQLLLSASQSVAQVGTEPRYTPQRPSLLPQLMNVVNDEEASLRTLSRIVAQDPRLTGEMLRAANSPLYRVSAAPVESIERAAALLGTRGIRMLISAVLLKPLAQAGGRTGRFGEIAWEHSMYSASAADAWAARGQDADPFAAQMLALLHGLGVVTVYRVLSDIYAAHPGLPRDAAAMASALDTSATMAAGRIAESWGLSERMRRALEAQSAAAPIGDSSPLARALHFGLQAGGLTLLCKHGQLTEEAAEEQITTGEFQGPLATRVWERLVRAYVRP